MTEQNINEQLLPDIMHYESDIWSIADLLRGAGIKDSKFPDYMMPYFALVMLEGRMKNEIARIEETDGITREEDLDGFVEYFKSMDCGYNDYIVRQNKTLQDICSNDKTFEQDFATYLKGFDNELKELLGIGRGTEDSKYLNIDGVNAELRKKKILQSVVTRWSMIDLAGYDNSSITTLEEHIKRRWADISAETAGEQYTPDDIISLIAEIVAAKINFKKDSYLSLYDPTCGGANLLFGTSDRLNEAGYPYVATYGCDFNDALYALAKIESKFRQKSFIKYGNTLTTLPFRNQSFQVIVANPPYGVKWSGYENDIKKDQTGQFSFLPPVSDGQLLFMQHILYQLNEDGLAVEVHNGSTLFSGDADKGESNIRKMMMDHDWVEAIVQMPTDEFFNTGITTYLWIMNKNKPMSHRDKIMLIDASDSWKLLKKSKGKKRREMTAEDRKNIVETLLEFKDCEIGKVHGKVFPKWHFYYNKQSIRITDESETHKSVLDTVCKNSKPYKLVLDHIDLGEETIDKFLGLKIEAGADTYARLNGFDYQEGRMMVTDHKGTEYWFDKDDNTIYSKTKEGIMKELGCGKFTFKISTSKKTNLSSISLVIEPVYISDYEIIPYKSEESENVKAIDAFLSKYVIKRFYKVSNAVGVEVSFNKEFYVPEELESVNELEIEIKQLSESLAELQGGLDLKSLINETVCRGLNKNVPLKSSGIDWIGDIPEHWEVKRIKDIGTLVLGKMLDNKGGEGFELKPYLKSRNIGWLNLDLSNVEEMYFNQAEMEQLRLKDGDLVFSEGGEVGKTSIWNDDIEECYIQNSVHKLTIKDKYCNRYFLYQSFVAGHLEFYNSYVNAVSLRHLTYEKLRRIVFVVPPLEEQQSIATYLDTKCSKIDAIVANIESQIEAYTKLKKSLISEVVTGKKRVI